MNELSLLDEVWVTAGKLSPADGFVVTPLTVTAYVLILSDSMILAHFVTGINETTEDITRNGSIHRREDALEVLLPRSLGSLHQFWVIALVHFIVLQNPAHNGWERNDVPFTETAGLSRHLRDCGRLGLDVVPGDAVDALHPAKLFDSMNVDHRLEVSPPVVVARKVGEGLVLHQPLELIWSDSQAVNLTFEDEILTNLKLELMLRISALYREELEVPGFPVLEVLGHDDADIFEDLAVHFLLGGE